MKIAVIGCGGHSKVIADMILSNKENEIVGFLDDKYDEVGLVENIYCGPISSVRQLVERYQDIKFVIAIGNNRVRQFIFQKLKLPDENYIPVIHKSAVISPSAVIGFGTVIMPNTVINAETRIGVHSIINTASVIEHDSLIGDFCHVCPGTNITGTVQLGEGSCIGAGATIIPNTKIGEWVTIGAGATVITDIPSYCTAVGIPAKIKKVNPMKVEVN
ncbi:acetyltransferase [Neobacillus sp. MM2021_6]|uniref:acetyltransferase n=1 Tax=Bacillaceae TaxID=186817 RepID=UPI00140C40F2|nr:MULTISPECIES: acetyltransferase [Bacillaceae]MBO0958850.1 acetyltransferase [Neobacillus sp. MM2021_6]NHC21323.1 acetyltransferase [Bacillus sp. MM2020_4]